MEKKFTVVVYPKQMFVYIRDPLSFYEARDLCNEIMWKLFDMERPGDPLEEQNAKAKP
jgi:hypothetical protein